MSEVRIEQYRLILLPDTPASRVENEAHLAMTHARVDEARRAYEMLITTPEARSFRDAFKASWADFERVDGEVRRLLAATQEIVRNVGQAAQGTGEVTSNIMGVAGAAEETGRAANQVLEASSALSRQSEHLSAEDDRLLANFRAA